MTRGDGPERIYGEWWRRTGEADAVRDYYQVEDEAGARFWLYRRGDGLDPRTGDLAGTCTGCSGDGDAPRRRAMTYAELQVTTHFSFLRGVSSCDELFAAAALLGLPALGIVDRNSVAGLVRGMVAARDDGDADGRRLPARSASTARSSLLRLAGGSRRLVAASPGC